MKKNNTKNAVVILGGGINALGIVRSFQKTDIPVIAMSWYNDYGMSSRFCKSVICPNPLDSDKLISFLIEFSKKQNLKPILFATSDLFLMPVIENKTILDEYYHIPVCEWDVLSPLIEKEKLYPLAEQLSIPCPKTKVVKNSSEFKFILDDLMFPLIIKPSVNINFSKAMGSKAFIIKGESEYNSFVDKISKTDLCKEGIIVQEYIPGDTTDLYTITSYANNKFEILAYSIGHKIRQYPPQTGTIISGKVTHVEEILLNAEKFIEATKFYGISNIEFKKDNRDGTYKLMEINPRTGVWNLSVLENGINLPLMAYNDILGVPITKEENKKDELVWMITPIDFYYSIWGFKRKGFDEFKISYKQWRNSIKGYTKIDSCFKWNDPMPFVKGIFKKFS